jgi:signal transduction histidine kinase
LRFASRSSTRTGLLVAAATLAMVAAALYAGADVTLLGAARVGAAIAAALLLGVYIILSERARHERIEEELAEQASFLESLIESMNVVSADSDPDGVLRRACREAERLFDADARLLAPGEQPARSRQPDHAMLVPLRAHERELGSLHLVRGRPFSRADIARATVLADFAARASDNARLLEEARVREAERARLSEQLITAEQDERRRLALFLHDGPVQSLAGIALMLDSVQHSITAGKPEEAQSVVAAALERHRDTIRALRDLSFNLEPVVLRDQGFGPAVKALAEQLGLAHEVQIEVDVDAADALGEQAQAALYQIIRDALNAAIRRGPPTRMSVEVRRSNGGIETVIADDAPGERRRTTFDALAERARTLNGQLAVEQGEDGGTTVSVTLPTYAAQG